MRTNLTKVTSPSRRSPSHLLLYLLFIFYLPRFTLLFFPSVSSLASLPFLSCCHRTTTSTIVCNYRQAYQTYVYKVLINSKCLIKVVINYRLRYSLCIDRTGFIEVSTLVRILHHVKCMLYF